MIGPTQNYFIIDSFLMAPLYSEIDRSNAAAKILRAVIAWMREMV